MSLKSQAKDSRKNDYLNLEIDETAVVIVQLEGEAIHSKKHSVGFKKIDCKGKGCPLCALGDNPPESWRLKAERELEDGVIEDCTLFFRGFGYAQFGDALPDRETGKCRMRATGVGAVDSEGKPVCNAQGKQYVNIAWACLDS